MKYSASLSACRNCGVIESTGTSSKPGGVISTAMSNTGLGNRGENRILVAISGTEPRADDADERDAIARRESGAERTPLPRRAPEVMGESQLPAATHTGDLALARLAAQLQPALEQHAQPRGADRMAERLEATVGIDRQLTVQVEHAGQYVLPRRAAAGEPE